LPPIDELICGDPDLLDATPRQGSLLRLERAGYGIAVASELDPILKIAATSDCGLGTLTAG
jgi:hypothetical protein